MRLSLSFCFATLALPLSCSLPATAQAKTPAVVWIAPAATAECPVSVSARMGQAANTEWVGRNWMGSGTMSNKDAQHPASVQITLRAPDDRQIRSAVVRVWGLEAQGRVLEAGSKTEGLISQQFKLRHSGAGTALDAEVSFRGARTLSRVELLELTFKDGTVWHTAAGARCTVVPDGIVDVASR